MKNVFISCLIFIFFTLQLSAQCLLKELSFSDRITASEIIIEGKIIEQNCFYNQNHTFIYTSNKVEVLKIFKGTISSEQIEIITEGGTIENERLTSMPSLNLKINDIGIFMAIPFEKDSIENANKKYKFYGSTQGFLKYNLAEKTASDPFNKYDVQNDLYKMMETNIGMTYNVIKNFGFNTISLVGLRASAAINNFSPTTITSGTNSVLTINGSGFGIERGNSKVTFKNSDDGGKTYIEPSIHQYISWSENQIKVRVPTQAGTGPFQVDVGTTSTSNDTLTINYSELNIVDNDDAFETNLVSTNTDGGITWNFNTKVEADSTVKNSFLRALSTWRCSTFINWKIGTTTSVNEPLKDAINVIAFDETNALPAGTLAVCYNFWHSCEPENWVSDEMDMIISQAINWQYGPGLPSTTAYDFESVILHELGHGHQLGHVIDKNDVMNYSIGHGNVRRIPTKNNLDAGHDVLSRSIVDNLCGYNKMSLLNTDNCNKAISNTIKNIFLVYPNPGIGFYNIVIQNTMQNVIINVYNSLGENVKTENISDKYNYFTLDLTGFAEGIYFLEMDNGKEIVKRKLVLEK